MVALRGLESSIARFTGVGDTRRGVGPFRAAGSGVWVPAPNLRIRGFFIEKPKGNWHPRKVGSIVQTRELCGIEGHGEDGAIIRNRYWATVPKELMQRLFQIESIIYDLLNAKVETAVKPFLTHRAIPTKKLRGIDVDGVWPLRTVGDAGTPKEEAIAIVEDWGGRGITMGYLIGPDGESQNIARKFGHSTEDGEVETIRKSVINSLAQRLTLILDRNISGVKYYVE